MTPDDDARDGIPPATVTPAASAPLRPGVRWMPRQGEQATGLLRRQPRLDDAARASLIQSSAEILGTGVDPSTMAGSATVLVVGMVQSGKTMSFTSVIALARDNGFPIVIVIAGNKNPLLVQSHDRLARDLDVDGGEGLPAWKMRKNIDPREAESEDLVRQTLADWADPSLEEDERATLVLTVLKNSQRLRSMTDLLRRFAPQLRDVPVLVIDDEADQASLNTRVNQNDESSTYTRLRELRDALPCHTYLQYTATPQAPLLINIADTLSPDFVRVLRPGEGYVGGQEFFTPGSPYVRDIPPGDLPAGGVFPQDPPDSLLEAMRLFFVGLASGTARRSMLVHPSRLRSDHREVVQWVSAIRDEWLRTLQLPAGDPDRQALVADFNASHADLATTTSDLPNFDEILRRLPRALRNTTPVEFNTNGRVRTPDIQWRHALGWVLVGGQAVDRGFTVDSLTVTYMPRGVGMGNADSLQQRARFFGYKRSYLGLCRVYLEPGTRQAFESYVEHEEIMRRELERIADTGESLRSWRRRLVLDPALRPCRASVISDDYIRARPSEGWTQQRGALMTPEARAANADAIARLANGLEFQLDSTTYPSSEVAQQHDVVRDAPLARVVDMLVEYQLQHPRDAAAFTGILVALGEALAADPGATATVYRMRPRANGRREVTDGNLEDGFLQGRTGQRGAGYPGDAEFKDASGVTLQLHSYDLDTGRGTPLLAGRAPLIAIHVPPALRRAWLVQLQSGQQAT